MTQASVTDNDDGGDGGNGGDGGDGGGGNGVARWLSATEAALHDAVETATSGCFAEKNVEWLAPSSTNAAEATLRAW